MTSFYGSSCDILDYLQGMNNKCYISDEEEEYFEGQDYFGNNYEDVDVPITPKKLEWQPIQKEEVVDTKECPICFNDEESELIVLQCQHKYCGDCLSQYINFKVNDLYTELRHIRYTLVKEEFAIAINRVLRCGVTCPHQGCWAILDLEWIKKFSDEVTEQIFNHQLLRQTIQSLGEVSHCPFGCGGYLQDNCLCTNEDCRVIMIKLRKFHEEAENQKTKEFGHWSSNNSKLCPHCRAQIEKNGGCDHMHCIHCRKAFLWSGALQFNPSNHLWWRPKRSKELLPKDKHMRMLYEIAQKQGIVKKLD